MNGSGKVARHAAAVYGGTLCVGKHSPRQQVPVAKGADGVDGHNLQVPASAMTAHHITSHHSSTGLLGTNQGPCHKPSRGSSSTPKRHAPRQAHRLMLRNGATHGATHQQGVCRAVTQYHNRTA